MGRAKTRLAADIGPVHAQRLYRAMTAKLTQGLRDPRWDIELAVTPTAWLGRVPEWQNLKQRPQVQGSLSPRLADIFKTKGPCIVIGTDCPQVTRQDIAQAFRALRRHEAVLGPADDGGFWLIGMRGPVAPRIFDNVRWSHACTLADMKRNISGPICELRTLIDVDDLKALRQVQADPRVWRLH